LDEFPAGSKGFCENSGLGMGIYWKTPGFRRETFSRKERVSLVCDVPAGSRIMNWDFFYSAVGRKMRKMHGVGRGGQCRVYSTVGYKEGQRR
jgi:hypothetical protein